MKVKISYFSFALIFVLLGASNGCVDNTAEPTEIRVDTSKVIARGVTDKIGINLNAGVDHDSNRPFGVRPLSDALKEMGTKRIRYPGGEKSNYFAWTADPNNPDPATNYWKHHDRNDYAAKALNTMNFDDFMMLCDQTGAKPHINVALPTRYNQAYWSQEFLIELATSWVRYANIEKKHNIQYWELGNEMWHNHKGLGEEKPDSSELVDWVVAFSKAMKAVDPSIRIGVSWRDESSKLQEFINQCNGTGFQALDCLFDSNYSQYGRSYKAYRKTENMDLIEINGTVSLNYVVSEFNATIFGEMDPPTRRWNHANNVGKGILNFDMIGQMLLSSKIEYGCIWNTRWYPNGRTHEYERKRTNVLDNHNQLTPVALPFVLWEKFIQDEMVEISNGNNPAIVSYATYSQTDSKLNVFLVNKELVPQTVSISFKDTIVSPEAEVWRYQGVDENDENPTLGKVDDISVQNTGIHYTLPATSITVFSL